MLLTISISVSCNPLYPKSFVHFEPLALNTMLDTKLAFSKEVLAQTIPVRKGDQLTQNPPQE